MVAESSAIRILFTFPLDTFEKLALQKRLFHGNTGLGEKNLQGFGAADRLFVGQVVAVEDGDDPPLAHNGADKNLVGDLLPQVLEQVSVPGGRLGPHHGWMLGFNDRTEGRFSVSRNSQPSHSRVGDSPGLLDAELAKPDDLVAPHHENDRPIHELGGKTEDHQGNASAEGGIGQFFEHPPQQRDAGARLHGLDLAVQVVTQLQAQFMPQIHHVARGNGELAGPEPPKHIQQITAKTVGFPEVPHPGSPRLDDVGIPQRPDPAFGVAVMVVGHDQ